jgi:hypothetical protein
MKPIFAALVLAALPLAAQAETLDIKTGAWELWEHTAIEGVPIAKEELDKMTPDERRKMEIAMRAKADDGKKVRSISCLTKETLDSSDLMGNVAANCTRKVVAQTKRYLEIKETCTAPPSSTLIRVEASSQEGYEGGIDRTEGDGKVQIQVTGRWMGPTCEKAADK